MPSLLPLSEAEKQLRLALDAISVLRQLGEHLDLPTTPALVDELVALARAQRRTLRAAHLQLEADPLLAHLLKSRTLYRQADARGGKSTKRLEDTVRSTFFVAQSLNFKAGIDDWRRLLAIFPR